MINSISKINKTPLFLFVMVLGCFMINGASQDVSQGLKKGDFLPALSYEKILQKGDSFSLSPESLEGRVVILEFFATWCGSCMPGMRHLNELADKFKDHPLSIITVTDEEETRMTEFLKKRPINGWILQDSDKSMFEEFDVSSRPHTVVIDTQGRVASISMPEFVTESVITRLLNGEEIDLPLKESRQANLDWDLDHIDWQDGVPPIFQVLIKPIKTATAGMKHVPGSNRITADGVGLSVLVQIAYETDYNHLDFQIPDDKSQYRVSVTVPKGQESQLLPTLKTALKSSFNIKTRWESREKDVYVLYRLPGRELKANNSQEGKSEMSFGRGRIRGSKQKLDDLLRPLTNFTGRIVIDETGLTGLYDWDLQYEAGNPQMLMDSVKDSLGLGLKKAKRPVQILVVTSGSEL